MANLNKRRSIPRRVTEAQEKRKSRRAAWRMALALSAVIAVAAWLVKSGGGL